VRAPVRIPTRANFAYPYFSRNIAEFWQRWHISLSTWFRDYFYIPLGGNRCSLGRIIFNILLTFTVSGLWHGANWTFIFWGLLNGLYFVPIVLRRHFWGRDAATAATVPTARDLPWIFLTFHLVLVGWIFFRSPSLGDALQVFRTIATDFDLRAFLAEGLKFKFLILILLALEWVQRRQEHPLHVETLPLPMRWVTYNVVVIAIFALGTFKYTPFIYFQF